MTTGEAPEAAREVGVIPLEAAPAMSVASESITVDAQVATAKAYPRSVELAVRNAITAATLDPETAASMTYSLKRSGKVIIGPSARLAEVMVQAWGNVRADIEPLDEEEKYVTAMATCFDVESNVAIRLKVRRRATDKRGKKFSDDMLVVTFNAAASVAYRNAVLKVIPAAIWRKVWDEAKRVATGEGPALEARRTKALEWFLEKGVSAEQVYAYLGVNGIEDIDARLLLILLGMAQAVKDGDVTVESMFRPERSDEGAAELEASLGGGS